MKRTINSFKKDIWQHIEKQHLLLFVKALQKAGSFVVLSFAKYKTQPVSKLSKQSKVIRSFVAAKFL